MIAIEADSNGRGAFSRTFRAALQRYALSTEMPLTAVFSALLFCGALIGILICAVFGAGANRASFFSAIARDRAFSSYASGTAYLRAFVPWFFFYEKQLLFLLMLSLCRFSAQLCGAYLLVRAFLLGFSSVMLAGGTFSLPFVVLEAGRCFVLFALMAFAVKCVLFSRDLHAAPTRENRPFSPGAAAALLCSFSVCSVVICAMLVLSSAAAELIL